MSELRVVGFGTVHARLLQVIEALDTFRISLNAVEVSGNRAQLDEIFLGFFNETEARIGEIEGLLADIERGCCEVGSRLRAAGCSDRCAEVC